MKSTVKKELESLSNDVKEHFEVKIPDHRSAMPEINEWDLINSILPKTRRVLLYGPPGTGKTHAATYLDTEGKTVYSLTLTEATPDAEIRGHFVPAGDGKFKWMDGPAIKAWKEGCPLVINEINRGSPEAQSFLYVLLDDPKTARITLPTGETVTPQEGFRVVATMNGRPDELPEALADRFPVSVEVMQTNPHALTQLPTELRKLARDTSNIVDEERRITIRSWLAFADLLRIGSDVDKAGKAVFNAKWEDLRVAVLVAMQPSPDKTRAK